MKSKIVNAIVSLVFSGVLLSGCAGFSGVPEQVVDIEQEISALRPAFSTELILEYYRTPAGAQRRSLRDQIITSRMRAIDLKFYQYTNELQKELRSGSFSLDTLSIALTGTAALLDPGTATTILAGVDTAGKGIRQSYNKEILVDQTLSILLIQMNANRKRLAAKIWIGLSKSDSEYPIGLGLSQLDDYFHAGTIMGALQKVSENTSIQYEKNNEEFENSMLLVQFGENRYTRLLNDYVKNAPNQDEKTRRLKRIQTIIDREGTNLPLAPFLINSNEPNYYNLQKKIVEELMLGGS